MLGAVPSTRTTRVLEVTCADCGNRFDLSVRNEYQHRRDGTPIRCRALQVPERGPPEPGRDRRGAGMVALELLDRRNQKLASVVSDEHHLLPRFRGVELDHREQQLCPEVEKALRESATEEELKANPFAAAGDPQRLRGLPAIGGRGSLGGAIAGTLPHVEVLRREKRARQHRRKL